MEKPQPGLAVLFVCTGNICRSPTAEGIFRHLLSRERLDIQVSVDSAGTHGYHVGEAPDRRSIRAAAKRGYDLSQLRARQLNEQDFKAFDYLLAMDRGHLQLMQDAAGPVYCSRVSLFLDFSHRFQGFEVPDPYYGGGQGFEHVLDLIEDGAAGLLAHVRRELGSE